MTQKYMPRILFERKIWYSLTSVLHTSLGENAQVRYSEVCIIGKKRPNDKNQLKKSVMEV